MSDPMPISDRPYKELMAAGHKAREAGDHAGAIKHYINAAHSTRDRHNQAQAYQAWGVSSRVLGKFATARPVLAYAVGYATATGDRLLLAEILRDVGEFYHDWALWGRRVARHDTHTALTQQREARATEAFESSLAITRGDIKAVMSHQATLGFYGMFLFDIGQRREGRNMVRRAAEGFRKNAAMLRYVAIPHNWVYDRNNQLRLIRCSFPFGFIHLRRAWWLTGKRRAPGRRLEILAALLGNRVYRALKRRQQRQGR